MKIQINSKDNEIGKKLCEILKLDPQNIRKINLVIEVDGVVYVELERYVSENEMNQILDIEFTKKEE